MPKGIAIPKHDKNRPWKPHSYSEMILAALSVKDGMVPIGPYEPPPQAHAGRLSASNTPSHRVRTTRERRRVVNVHAGVNRKHMRRRKREEERAVARRKIVDRRERLLAEVAE